MPNNNSRGTTYNDFVNTVSYATTGNRTGIVNDTISEEPISGDGFSVETLGDKNSIEYIRKTMKERHLSKRERQDFISQKRDWLMTGKGEICRSSSVLVVDDLVDMCR